jgi:hypothetical protein
LRGFAARYLEGSRHLIVYYVNAPVRGVPIACILSHWTNDIALKDKDLPALLATVTELK